MSTLTTHVHPALVFLGGLVVVVLGAELLLRSATRVANMLGVAPIVIGLTIVSLGTSMPELAVGITAASEGKGSLAVGNIVGANIMIILLVLGLSAAIQPLPIGGRAARLDLPAMIAAVSALIIISLDGVLLRTEGALLLLGALAYTGLIVQWSRREGRRVRAEFAAEFAAAPAPAAQRGRLFAGHGLLLAGAIALTVLGADLLVAGATDLALAFGVSDAVIGLTIVALGTSSPELATTLVATLRGDRDVAIGNLMGSSVYNILAILGMTLLVSPLPVDLSRDLLRIDLPIALTVALVCWPVFRSDRQISRREGLLFVGGYLSYLLLLLVLRT